MPRTNVSYLDKALNAVDRKDAIKTAVERLKGVQFDAIAVKGVSGMAFGSVLSYVLDKQLIVVRKGETTHSNTQVEIPTGVRSYIVVDDLIASGRTVGSVIDSIYRMTEPRYTFENKTVNIPICQDLRCIGVYLYQNGLDDDYESPGFYDIKSHKLEYVLSYAPTYRDEVIKK